MAVEEQIQQDTMVGLSVPGGRATAGQNFTLIIPSRRITKLAFKLVKLGLPTGDVTFTIRLWGPGTIRNSKVWGDASDLPIGWLPEAWTEVEFDTPQLIEELVTMNVEFGGGDAGNQVAAGLKSSDVKPDEYLVLDLGDVVPGSDFTYRYTYEEAPTGMRGLNPALMELLTA